MKRLLLVFALVVLALPASASASVFTTELGSPFPAGDATYGLVANDFNGDGFVDVAAINGTGSTMNVYLRQPTGGFVQEAGSPYATGSGPNFGASADFNGDGLNDIAVANFVGASVQIYLRNPAGGFTIGQSVGLSGQGSAIAAGEVNGDGFVDLVVTNFGGQGLNVLRGQGNGTFSNQELTTAGSSARQLALADFNGDGDGAVDVAVANEASNNVSIMLRDSGRTAFVLETTIPVGTTPSGVVAADFNRDGRNDVAVSTRGGDPSTVTLLYRNSANNGFDAGPVVPVPAGPLGLATGDFDRNGTPDIAVTANAAGVVTVLSGGTTLDTTLPLARAYFPAVADFNRDGQPDLAVSADTSNSFSVFLNNTAPPTQPPPPPPTPTPTPVATPVAGTTVNAEPVKGTVKVKLPRTSRYVDLKTAGLLPVGTEVDARKGTIEITAAGQGGRAKFFDGIFKISQTKGARPLTTLTLTEKLSCPKAKKSGAQAAAAKKKSRKLWGDGKGSFRTAGKYSAATVRGTKWLVTDYCDRTVTRVTQGTVTVRDNVKKINKVVRKGKSYTARAKKGR